METRKGENTKGKKGTHVSNVLDLCDPCLGSKKWERKGGMSKETKEEEEKGVSDYNWWFSSLFSLSSFLCFGSVKKKARKEQKPKEKKSIHVHNTHDSLYFLIHIQGKNRGGIFFLLYPFILLIVSNL